MTVDAIIASLGGSRAVQQLLGVGPSAISNYRRRGQFPDYTHLRLWQALRARGIAVDPAGLAAAQPLALVPPAAAEQAKPVLLVISGGIAAYKSLEVIRRLREHGIALRCIMTEAAKQFITPLSVSALLGGPVYDQLFSLTDEAEMGHIRLAREAGLILVAPASADIIARMAAGMANDLATTTLLASSAPVLLAPAMNPHMWANPATAENCRRLKQRGVTLLGPASGDMACGEEGPGRMMEPLQLVQAVLCRLGRQQALAGHHALVTSGPTHEPIDAVRYIANRSSGRQGHAIAAALAAAGARVTLVSGPVQLPPPAGVNLVAVETAAEMLAACEAALPADIAICAAAVADWSVEAASADTNKRKKQPGVAPAPLILQENPDILASLSRHRQRPSLVIGFSAETETLLANSRAKRQRKGCDWIIANQVTDGAVFGAEHNRVTLIDGETSDAWPEMTKTEVASRLTDRIIAHQQQLQGLAI